MPASIQNLSVQARSLMFVAVLSQAGLAFGGFTPLQHDTNVPPHMQVAAQVTASKRTEAAVASTVLDQFSAGEVTMPVVELAPVANQAVAPASVPLPPALETGLSGGAALMLAAGLRKLRRIIRRF